jgi:transposase
MDYYIGLDAHSKTCSFVALTKEGEIAKEGKFNTSDRNLKDLTSSFKGKVSLMLEEANIAQWVYCILKDEIEEVIVCHSAYLPKKSGPKNDHRDALHLAIQLRAGNYTPVYHADNDLMNLRTLVTHYEGAAVRLGVLKQNFKALLRSEGVSSQSSHHTSRNKTKINEIQNPMKKVVAERLFDEMFALEENKKKWADEFKANRFNMPLVKNLSSIPGVGPVRANTIAAYMSTGHRFTNKHKLWSYAKLIRHRDESDGYILRRRTPHGRSELKNSFMGAAQRVVMSASRTALKEYYEHLINEKKLDKRKANKALARKIAAICLCVMKKGTKYDDQLVRSSFMN